MKLRRAVATVGIWAVLFAGGAGSTRAIEEAGHTVSVAVNHSPVALAVHEANHPHTRHMVTDVWDVDPVEAAGGRPVYGLWASPDCRDFSIAKGGKPRDKKIRSLAWVVCRWAKAVAPQIIFLENVREFAGWGPLLTNGKRDPKRAGKTFRAWVSKLRSYGYEVEWRILNAADYGAPTSRKRLFLVARRDGLPIVWPEPTHGPGRAQPYRTAADCIDWSIPGKSIFGRKKPLAEKTLWRLAQCLRRFVFENPNPYVRKLDPENDNVTASMLQQSGYGEREGQRARGMQLDLPLGTVVAAGQKHALVQVELAAFLVKHFGDPLRSDGGGGVVLGQDLDRPIGTVTTRDHHSLAAVTLCKFRGTSESHRSACSVEEPLPTVSSGGKRGGVHVAEVRAFLLAYYGNDATGGQQLELPMRTITTVARLGIVMIHGTPYQIVDITFRMLQPHELLRAQCGEFADDYDISAAKTKAEQIEIIGNMVCPHPARALVAANAPTEEARAA